ncbi:major facilitator superfamily domain-containing protein [Lipomyces oligophaga]|uniref:major facilitator superfamily domain-containing protein n=1 Tax=Lipomyces oligophaga TaxID=45792 RepID=UPI0034CE3504
MMESLQTKLDTKKALKNASQDIRPPVFRSLFHEIVVLVALTFGSSLATSNVGAAQIAIDHFATSFNISGGKLSWTVSSFSLSAGAFVLLLASIADNIGRRRTVLIAYIWYAIWCLIAGFMRSDVIFCVFRALQGLSGAAATPAAVGVIGATYTFGKRKNRAMATFGAGAPLGLVIGIIVGGICTQFISWRAEYWFFSIQYSILAVIVWFLVPPDPPLDRTILKQKLAQIDYVGAFLATLGLVLFVFAITQSGVAPKGWGEPYVIALLIIGPCLFGVFIYWESRVSNPLMPLSIWRFPGFAVCMVIIFCGFMSFLGVVNYYITLFFQNVRGASPILTTAYIVPQAIAGLSVNFFAALTLHIIPGRILMIVGNVAFVVSALLWALQPMHLIYWAMSFPAIVLSVVGADLSFNVANLHTLSSVPPESQSTAAGVFNTVMQLSASTVAQTALEKSPHTGRQQTYDSYKAAFWFGVGISACGAVASLFLKVGRTGSKHDVAADDGEDQPDNIGDIVGGPQEREEVQEKEKLGKDDIVAEHSA